MESVRETTAILMGFVMGSVVGTLFSVFVIDMLGLGLHAFGH